MLWPERERSQVGVPSVAREERMCDAHPGARSRVQHTRAALEEGVVRSPCALCFSLCVCDHPRGFSQGKRPRCCCLEAHSVGAEVDRGGAQWHGQAGYSKTQSCEENWSQYTLLRMISGNVWLTNDAHCRIRRRFGGWASRSAKCSP